MSFSAKTVTTIAILGAFVGIVAGCGHMQLEFQKPEGARVVWDGDEAHPIVITPLADESKRVWRLRNTSANSTHRILISDIEGEPDLVICGKVRTGKEVKPYTERTSIPVEITTDDILNVKNSMTVKKVIFIVDPEKKERYEKKVDHAYFEDFGWYQSGPGAFTALYSQGPSGKDPEEVANAVGHVLVVIELGNRRPSDSRAIPVETATAE